jgi:hypothetical protein
VVGENKIHTSVVENLELATIISCRTFKKVKVWYFRTAHRAVLYELHRVS